MLDCQSRKLMKSELGYWNCQLRKLTLENDSISSLLCAKFDPNLWAAVSALYKIQYNRTFEKVKSRHISKLNKLHQERLSDQRPLWQDKNYRDSLVVNLSKRQLSEAELDVLALGEKFSIAPKTLPLLDILAPIEAITKDEKLILNRDKICTGIAQIIQSFHPITIQPNLLPSHHHAITQLKTDIKDKNIRVLKADKGERTVVMDFDHYNSEIIKLLSDQNTYSEITPKELNSTLAKRRKEMKTLFDQELRSERITKKQYFEWLPSLDRSRIPYLYALPKIHKPQLAMRPIVSCVNSLCHPISKHLAKLLSPLLGIRQTHLKDSCQFIQALTDANVDWDSVVLASLDVTSLFTNVHVPTALQHLRSRLENHDINTLLSDHFIISLISICAQPSVFTFNDKCYKQLYGLPMGNSLAPLLSCIYLEELEYQTISQLPISIPFYRRYVDDVCVIVNNQDCLNTLASALNIADPENRIKFTQELESNGSMPFLDTLLDRKNGELSISVYRKPTNSNRFIHFSSCPPTIQKFGVVRTLARRAHQLSSDYQSLNIEKSVTLAKLEEKLDAD